MDSATVRITTTSRNTLRALATQTGESMQSVLEKAIEAYRRACFLEGANRAFEKLRKESHDWSEELKERADWEQTLSDGLEDD